MADALLSPLIGASMYIASAAATAYSVVKIKKDDLTDKKVPIMAVTGAFVFAAQMINFTIPGTGASGHIGGGILLAGMLGAFPAFLAMAAVLIIQCLFFADGGLLALGCNIFNMGVIPCLLVYPLLFKPFLKNQITPKRITIASVAACGVGLQLGAFGVVLQTQLSGVTALPFTTFLVLMQPIHLAIGLMEGLITAGVLSFVYRMRPEIIESVNAKTSIARTVSVKGLVVSLAVAAVIVGGGLSLLASANPDGLEWAIEKTTGASELEAEGEIHEAAADAQAATAFMPDYDSKSAAGNPVSTTVAGLVGGVCVFALAGGVGLLISRVKKTKKRDTAV